MKAVLLYPHTIIYTRMLLLFTELPGATACGAPNGDLQLSNFIHSAQAVLVVL